MSEEKSFWSYFKGRHIGTSEATHDPSHIAHITTTPDPSSSMASIWSGGSGNSHSQSDTSNAAAFIVFVVILPTFVIANFSHPIMNAGILAGKIAIAAGATFFGAALANIATYKIIKRLSRKKDSKKHIVVRSIAGLSVASIVLAATYKHFESQANYPSITIIHKKTRENRHDSYRSEELIIGQSSLFYTSLARTQERCVNSQYTICSIVREIPAETPACMMLTRNLDRAGQTIYYSGSRTHDANDLQSLVPQNLSCTGRPRYTRDGHGISCTANETFYCNTESALREISAIMTNPRPTTPQTTHSLGQRFTIAVNNTLNLRSTPNTTDSNNFVASLEAGSCITLRGTWRNHNFVQVEGQTAAGVEYSGYVHSRYLRANNTITSTACRLRIAN